MHSRTLSKIGVALFTFCFSLFVQAEAPLTGDLIDRWIKSQKAVQEWGDKHEEELSKYEKDNEMIPTNIDDIVAPLKASGLYGQVEDIVEGYGFSTPEEWASTALRIFGAYAAIEMQGQQVDMDAMRQQLAELEKNPNISAEQKKMMRDMMQQGLAMMEKFKNAPPEDVEAVKPHMSKLRKVMEESGGGLDD
ncbi:MULTISPECIES: hypothetical protein [unclassified Hahella]|uniref:hypothetical protein n=1 Tax=unclassified Hahella TaxID=2624107 RepID=UPI001C1ED887|nr:MULTISPECIES: hypothetical protein [unclassified Hahella]MBU6952499.1 hypothetical protein [Hahella sp. HN01]MDG9671938.1 hypothetical protein [Hahella sp. CR1]